MEAGKTKRVNSKLAKPRSQVSGEGRIVLVQFKSDGISENGGRYTVKKYQSVKSVTEDDWNHERIELQPKNSDYDHIIVEPYEAGEMVVVGEWVACID